MVVTVGLLGGLEVRSDEGRITGAQFASRKARQVFAMLVLSQGRTLSKYELVDTVWRRRMPQNPASTVEVAVSLARGALKEIGAAHILVTEPGGYRVDTEQAVVDVTSFDDLLAIAARSPERDRVPPLREALHLVRGPLLQDEEASDWVLLHRNRYQQRIQGARLGLAQAAFAAGDLEFAVRAAEDAWLAADVVFEEAYVVAVRGLIELGRITEARAVHAAALRRLQVEEQRVPGAELAALELELQPRPIAPVVRTPVAIDRAFSKVPSPVPFLGRLDELEVLHQAIAGTVERGRTSTVEVIGPPGMGRSRLLQEVADRHPQDRVVLARCLTGDVAHPLLATGRIVRSIAGAAHTAAPSIDESVTVMFGRLTEFFDLVGPTVVLIDDLHLADVGTLALWRSLVEPGGAAGLCVVATSPQRCWDWVPNADRLVLGPLRPLFEEEMVSLLVPDVWGETGGNPVVLDALVADASQRRLRPEGVQRIEMLVSALGPLALDALTAASARPRSFTPADLVRPGLDEATAARLVEAATSVGLVRRTRDGRCRMAAEAVVRVLRSTDHAAG